MEKIIYFVRHGETEYNRKRIIQGSGVDSDLNELGLAQANAFYQHYKQENFDHIYASALKRSQQTIAQFINENSNFTYSPLINEINWGKHEGTAYNEELIGNYQELVAQWKQGNFDASVEGGESANELGKRCSEFLEIIKEQKAKKILVCTHGRTLRCLMALASRQTLDFMETYSHHNTGLYLVQYNSDGFKILKNNDIEHLQNLNLNE